MRSIEELRKIIYDQKASYVDVWWAASELCGLSDASYPDLLQCLKLGGVAASQAACALYVRTKRARRTDEQLVTDVDDWRLYLAQHGLLG